jgi:hypothetical protein
MAASLIRDWVARDMAEELDCLMHQRVSGILKLRSSELLCQVNWKHRPFYVLLLLGKRLNCIPHPGKGTPALAGVLDEVQLTFLAWQHPIHSILRKPGS